MRLNFSGRLYPVVPYHVRESDFRVDMAEVERLALEHRPKMIVAGWSAHPRQLDFAEFRRIADLVGAYLLVDMAHFAGLVAAGLHANPVPYADVVTTTTHKTLGGPRGGVILSRAELARKIDSAVFPGQQGGPLEHVIAAKAVAFRIAAGEDFRRRQRRTLDGVSSGLRVGMPALATRGLDDAAFREVADLIAAALVAPLTDDRAAELRSRAEALARSFPLYPDLAVADRAAAGAP
jgi:glycine/serine hydroxymethyltransferase